MLQRLSVWVDPVLRCGPEAMAVDEWLLGWCAANGRAVLRVYGWRGEWGSLGYFGRLEEARRELPEVEWVRRLTGGGVVDHRADWTYTLAVPFSERLTGLRGGESYRWVHAALAGALMEEAVSARLCGRERETGGALCFSNPVEFDLVGEDGRKLAGAGQRRTREGLLHQGSCARGGGDRGRRAAALAARLADVWEEIALEPPPAWLAKRVEERYGDVAWLERR